MTRKTPIIVILSLLLTLLFVSCNNNSAPSEDPKNDEKPTEVVTITIPDVTVDLKAPENKVEVSESESSYVTDSEGRRLSDSEWLLNSKFSKEYIKALGAGVYTFTYKSASKTGTIKLTVTDSEKPDYIFTSEISPVVELYESLTLPTLLKNQDSYQGDYTPSYTLKCGDDDVEFTNSDGVLTTAPLAGGNYTWTAVIERDGTPYTYEQSFKVQTFDEFLAANIDTFVYLKQEQRNIAPDDNGIYSINTLNNTGDYHYTMSQHVIDKAIAAGKTQITFKLVTDKNAAGNIWMTNSWEGYNIGIASEETKVTDNLSAEHNPYYHSTDITVDPETGEVVYTYIATAVLDKGYFTMASPLQYQFAYSMKLEGDLIITFN